jgi:hypothetical protein
MLLSQVQLRFIVMAYHFEKTIASPDQPTKDERRLRTYRQNRLDFEVPDKSLVCLIPPIAERSLITLKLS